MESERCADCGAEGASLCWVTNPAAMRCADCSDAERAKWLEAQAAMPTVRTRARQRRFSGSSRRMRSVA